jgi:transaldolase
LEKGKKKEEERIVGGKRMTENPLIGLKEVGQSVWLDNLSRKLIQSGELKRLIDEDGVSGITSNPTIFQKAISGSTDYDSSLRRMIDHEVKNEKELFLGVAMEDVSRAADFLWPTYQSTNGQDGFVSIEVSPDLAYDTEATISEAKRLFSTLGRKNILVKVPGTKQGIPAIEQLTSEGVNVNVTLLFSTERYEEIAEAYLKGLERRVSQGQPINEIASVASFFVSRVDTLTDKLLEARLSSIAPKAEKDKIAGLFGKAAVANAKIAYKKYRSILSGKRFLALKGKGGHIQRILWGSTGTKNPSYSDIKYVEELIAPDSINTLPEATITAFKDHGQAKMTIHDDLKEAEKLFPELKLVGIDIREVTDQLEKEGVQLFSDSFFALLKEIAKKRDSFLIQPHH